MTTWDDKPNDYAAAIAEIERLRAENKQLCEQLDGSRKLWKKELATNAAMLAALKRWQHYDDEMLIAAFRDQMFQDMMDQTNAAIKLAEGEG